MGENIPGDRQMRLGLETTASSSIPVNSQQNALETQDALASCHMMQVISPDVSVVLGVGGRDSVVQSSADMPESGVEREEGSVHLYTSDPPPYTQESPVNPRFEPLSSGSAFERNSHPFPVIPGSAQDGCAPLDPMRPRILSEHAPVAEARRRQGSLTRPSAKTAQATNRDGASTFKRLQENRFGLNFLRPRSQNINPSPQNGFTSADGDCGSSGSTVACVSTTAAAPVSEKRRQIVDANIVIFGETGVGKSSVINLIADEELAHTSNDAVGCTFNYKQHFLSLDEVSCSLWDTVGLDEGSEGTVPAKEAENNLRDLMQAVAHSGGIHLVMYCIRGTRLTKALKHNYHLFYVTVCRRKVPVVLVVTGLEHQEDTMETWWTENEAELRRNGMWFDAHACVTTLNVADHGIQQRRFESRMLLCELVIKYAGLPGWKTDPSFLSRIMPHFHNRLHRVPNLDQKRIIRKVAVLSTPFPFLPGTSAAWEEGTAKIGDRRYKFFRVDKDTLEAVKPKKSKGVGLLIFYSSPLVDNQLPLADLVALKKFYDIAGGQICPLVVVLPGRDDELAAWTCRMQITSCHHDIRPHFVSLSSTDEASAKLDERIQAMCMDQTEIKAQNFFKKMLT